MSKFKDITGQRFGRLTVLYRLHNIKGKTKWFCVCDCGNLKEVTLSDLKKGNTQSCGCLYKDIHTKHKKCDTRLYCIFGAVKSRCYNKNNKRYKDYGGRGIAVCDEWKDDFMSFYNWAILNGYNDTLTIDRIDVNGNYEPSNCRWVTPKQQARNRRSNRNYTINGETHCLKEWCEIVGLNYRTVQYRINILNQNIERALRL